MAGYQRFCQLMDTPSENTDLPGAFDCGTLKGSISFKNVNFGYDPGKPVIQNFDFDIAAGEVIALSALQVLVKARSATCCRVSMNFSRALSPLTEWISAM